jgi:uncharacterized repeat protein (TIGR01451 family)
LPHFDKWLAPLALFAFLFGAAASAQASIPPTCTATVGAVTPTLRSEGMTELAGDIIILCTGGPAVPAGSMLPQGQITVFLNTSVTSRLAGTGYDSEALLLIDEPGSALPGAPATQLACATSAGCSIVSNGAEPYDGSPGHPNVFQGYVVNNTVTFSGIPFSNPGEYGINSNGTYTRVLRITNLRVPTGAVIAGYPVNASISNNLGPPTPNSSLNIAFIESGLSYQTRNAANTASVTTVDLSACSAGSYCPVAILQFQENFATAFKTRVQGMAQNIPGQIYNTESGFYNPGLGASNPELATAGYADAGTRLKADFYNIPFGAQVWVGLNSVGSTSAALTTNETGPFASVAGLQMLTNSSSGITSVPAAPLTITNLAAKAVWEINSVNPAAIDTAQFPVWVYFPPGTPPSGSLTLAGSLAPNPSDGAFLSSSGAFAQNSTYPIPRFMSSPAPSISSLAPSSSAAGWAPFLLTVNGSGFLAGATVYWQGTPLTTNFLTSNQLTATVPSSDIAVGGTASVTVANPGGPESLPQTYTVTGPVSVTPASGGGSSQIFSFVYDDALGASDMSSILVAFGNSTNNSCSVLVAPQTGVVSLANDAAEFASQSTIGAPGTLENDQCTLNTGISSATASANIYTLNLALTFQSSFSGVQTITSSLASQSGTGTGGITLGAWTVPAASQQQLGAVSVTPASGTGLSQTFVVAFNDNLGATDLASVQALFNSSISSAVGCAVSVNPQTAAVTLASNTGSSPAGQSTLGTAGTLQNNQCALNVGASSAVSSGNTYTLTLSLTFLNLNGVAASGFAGTQNIYGFACSNENFCSSWQSLGSWTVPQPVSVIQASVNPSSGSAAAETFTFSFTDSLGASDMDALNIIFSPTSSGTVNSCVVSIDPQRGNVALFPDSAGIPPTQSALGTTGSLQNSQCAVNVGASSGATSGNTYTLVLSMSFSNSYVGTKNIYFAGASTSGGYVSLQTVGTWTIPATSIFSPNAVPTTPFLGGSLTVGVKFRSDVSGNITGIRFYKGVSNNGTHIGLLYSSSGTLLAQATFTGETASGWQQVNFSTPVAITANTVYVAAYFSTTGFAYTLGYFTSAGVNNAPLHALAYGVSGPNGVYAYGSTAQFPSGDGEGSNYWADVVFSSTGTIAGASDLTITSSHTGNFTQGETGATYSVTATNSGAASTSGTVTVTETLPTGLTAVSMLGNNWTCTQPAGPCTRSDALAAGSSYDPIRVTVNVSATAPSSVTNTATVSGGGETNTVNDQATDPTTIASVSVTTGSTASIWPTSAVPAVPYLTSSLTVGVKFRSDVSGNITGIRFYKGAGNNGTHIGLLYGSTGTLLAQATFTGETASGWQQVNFSTPVAITANTVYVAAYFSTTGFAYTLGYFTGTGVDNVPLHALAYGVSGPNGVYAYGSAAQFPSGDGEGSNYWADVIFSSSGTIPGTPDLTITSSHTGNFTQGQNGVTYTVTATNGGAASTTGSVTVTETVPTGLTAVSMLGNNWTCTQPAGPCTRSDALAVGLSYDPITVTVNVSASAPSSVTNTATVSGGGETNTANDQATDPTTIASASVTSSTTSIWPISAAPAVPYLSSSLTVGVKFRSDVSGNIAGIRFYKGVGNNGTHIGLLYSSSGTLLAQATFTGETASGWQQVNFSTPVSITANTVYVAAYFSTTGFAYTLGYFTNTGFDNAPLHALAYGVSGPNGVYAYGSAAQFPSGDGEGSNYWADVVFSTGTIAGTSDLTITSSHTGSFTQGETGATYTVTATNSGTAATSGTVTVTETLPTGLMAVSMLGNNWTCTQPAGPCTRSDALAAGSSYDPITVTVNVSATAPASVTNTATVSGGAETNTANDTATDPTTIASASVTTGSTVSIWPTSAVPANPYLSSSLTVGVKFRSDVSGNITGIRFYKGAGNNGTHIALLYNSGGTLLAQATFAGETASGWQQVNFSTPVAIAANTVYVAAYFSTTGFAYTLGYFTSTGFDNAPLHALADGVSGPNAVYAYGSTAQFPSGDGFGSNYWADVVFSSTGTIPTGTPDLTITSTHTGNFTQGETGATYTVTATNSGTASTTGTVTVTETLPTGLAAVSMLGNNWTCPQPAGPCTRSDALAAGLSYDPITVTVNVSATAPASVTNTATVSGGAETNTANDAAMDPTTIASASVTTGSTVSIWPTSAVPTVPYLSSSLTVGVKFRSDVSGNITGIRFYKGAGNNGAHIGLLYSSSGTLLAQATFTGETASGWQQVNFSTPVAITANTVYVAAYFSTTGFAYTLGYFTSTGVDNAPLHALAYGVSGPNGVYAYGSTAQFPSGDGEGSNYWADVVFSSIGTITGTPDLTIAASHTGNFTQGQNGATYTVTATNSGTASTSGAVTVTETLPTDLTAVSMLGNNWTCTQPAGPCTRSDALTAGSGYDPITVTVNVSATAPSSVTNTATVSGGGETNAPNDTATDPTTILSASSGTTTSIWPASAVPAVPYLSSSLTVGVKFRSDVSGNITGIRFYKGVGNNGTHIGLLYSSSGTLLAQATFTGETASGWQQVNFSTPVAITANTVYVAAYFSTTGFAYTLGYFTSTGVDNAPLHALADGVSGPNAVYAYGSAAQLPTGDGEGSNYWADVVFSQ